ncbi:MAG: dipeptide ABC transporter ATP-binding protein [Hyphomicrobiales bacterium]|nr:dipeptide ABC transporter ATP-binding protein [Hyphomicrobiales bacterium]
MSNAPLIEARGLGKHFPARGGGGAGGTVRAVEDLSISIPEGETFALVGESGCGKSTTGRLLLRLIEPTAGQIFYRGEDLATLSPSAMRERRRELQIVFQDPYGSLNPRMSVGEIIAEPLTIHGIGDRAGRRARVSELLSLVGLAPEHALRFPHEFSGGQRQRIGIARALALEPRFIVCDEPVSALDVSIQAQILTLMQSLQKRLGLTYLFISHNLAVVRQVADRVAVMYLGRIVEEAPTEELFSNPCHPYTQALLSAMPSAHPARSRQRILLKGDVPSPFSPPSGCRFHTRCPIAVDACRTLDPATVEIAPGHGAACHVRAPARSGG